MIENQDILKPGELFPKEMEAPERADVLIELSKFGIGSANTIKLIDTTRDAQDVRLNYVIDKRYVLRFCNAPDMTEKRMGELNRLIGRYRAMGLKCPAFIADDNGKYLHPWKQFICYLSEYVDLPLAEDIELKDEDQLNCQVNESVAVLIDDAQHFVGFIDFNLAGTEVIVNQLVNLAGFDYDEKQTDPEGAEARLEFAICHFQNHISRMLRVYHATEKEQQALIWYAWIVMVAQWPNFCFFKYAINGGILKKEICELLSLIADLPEERLLVSVN